MLPALRSQGFAALRRDERDGGAVGAEAEDAADFADGNAGDGAGQTDGGWSGEKEFVVFASVEGMGEGCGWVDGQGVQIDFGGYAGFFTEVGEIGGKAVAKVDGGGGHVVADQPEALGYAGLRVKMRG